MTDDDLFEPAASSPPGPGPQFAATYESTCSVALDDIQPGDTIRADGEGGYAHALCLRLDSEDVIR